jgi:LacI family transcriptional regulator
MSEPGPVRRSTIRDVAARAGVSVASVSNVLGGRDDQTSRATKRKIERAIEELGFVPSASARQLRGQRVHSLGLIVHSLLNPSTIMLVRGAEHAAQERGYSLLLADMDREAERTPASVDAMIVGKVDGVIMTSYIAGDVDLAARLRSRGTPAVVVTAGIPPTLDAPALGIDNESGVRAIVDHLTGLGHARLAFVVHSRASLHSRARLAAFRHEMSVRHLALPDAYVVDVDVSDAVHAHDYDLHAGRLAVETLRRLDRPPTAIVAAYDMVALGVLAGAREIGWDVPGSVSLTGFDDIPVASTTWPPLTTVHVPMYEIGRAAVGTLIDSFGGPAQRGVVFSPDLVVRSSTAIAAADEEDRSAS